MTMQEQADRLGVSVPELRRVLREKLSTHQRARAERDKYKRMPEPGGPLLDPAGFADVARKLGV